MSFHSRRATGCALARVFQSRYKRDCRGIVLRVFYKRPWILELSARERIPVNKFPLRIQIFHKCTRRARRTTLHWASFPKIPAEGEREKEKGEENKTLVQCILTILRYFRGIWRSLCFPRKGSTGRLTFFRRCEGKYTASSERDKKNVNSTTWWICSRSQRNSLEFCLIRNSHLYIPLSESWSIDKFDVYLVMFAPDYFMFRGQWNELKQTSLPTCLFAPSMSFWFLLVFLEKYRVRPCLKGSQVIVCLKKDQPTIPKSHITAYLFPCMPHMLRSFLLAIDVLSPSLSSPRSLSHSCSLFVFIHIHKKT